MVAQIFERATSHSGNQMERESLKAQAYANTGLISPNQLAAGNAMAYTTCAGTGGSSYAGDALTSLLAAQNNG